jgi:hypothetical protein
MRGDGSDLVTHMSRRCDPCRGGRVVMVALIAALWGAAAGSAGAQALEVRGGASVGNHAPAAAGLELHPGPIFAVTLEYPVTSRLAVYAGYGRATFGCRDGFCSDQEVVVTSSGYSSGVRLAPGSPFWARAGITRDATAVAVSGERHRTDPAVGYEFAGGLSLPVLRRLELVTGLSYRSRPDPETRTTVLGLEIGGRVLLGRTAASAAGD